MTSFNNVYRKDKNGSWKTKTDQKKDKLKDIFNDQVETYHSGVTPKRRYEIWEKARSGEPVIPLSKIGLLLFVLIIALNASFCLDVKLFLNLKSYFLLSILGMALTSTFGLSFFKYAGVNVSITCPIG